MKRIIVLLLLPLLLVVACASGGNQEADLSTEGEQVVTVFRSPT